MLERDKLRFDGRQNLLDKVTHIYIHTRTHHAHAHTLINISKYKLV
jgi:hypothetical protein